MSRHDDKPQDDSFDPAVLARLEELQESSYVATIKPLASKVVGRTVVSSEAGHSGFVLRLDDDSWVAAFVQAESLAWAAGFGSVDSSVMQRLSNPGCADLSRPLDLDAPYAAEPCDISAELRLAHGSKITGLAYGEACFNFCFSEGRELDTRILRKDGRLGLRVYWEQWQGAA